ncbi:hypothetical protein [Halorubrum sp. F4]|uniref:hypothetical protein n=1 Tax=Halorubrum sp. F4 TaxID=2989715 RepID=UPI002480101A|nr:hypothetical protein [Halorubrum sp. F4]
MNRRRFLAVAGATSLAGCTAPFGPEESSRLDLTVRNDRADPITVRVEVVDAEGTTYEDGSDRIDGGVARAFEVIGGQEGRHEVTVSGDGFRGQLAWNAATCRLFDGRVRVTDDLVEVAGECVDQR